MKVGIITMHRVQNMGSVLQAYALQRKLMQMGFDSEIIDYIFPSIEKKQSKKNDTRNIIINAFLGFPKQRTEKKLEKFRNKYLHCSSLSYTKESIILNPPLYDVYCTGSDQVWNPQHVKDDVSFMLNFAPDGKPRIAYASSFASNNIEEPYFSLYAKNLKKYKAITVREKNGVEIVRKMTGMEAPVVCDPTLLLTTDEWGLIADDSTVNIKGNYILVYLLGYMFNPRPVFYNIVESIRKKTGLPVYYFNPHVRDMLQRHTHNLQGLGPEDFVKLCQNASFIITDSFHGTVFATIFNVPMIGVVKDKYEGDGRISTLREEVAGKKSVVCQSSCEGFSIYDDDFYKCNSERVESLRSFSLSELSRMLKMID